MLLGQSLPPNPNAHPNAHHGPSGFCWETKCVNNLTKTIGKRRAGRSQPNKSFDFATIPHNPDFIRGPEWMRFLTPRFYEGPVINHTFF